MVSCVNRMNQLGTIKESLRIVSSDPYVPTPAALVRENLCSARPTQAEQNLNRVPPVIGCQPPGRYSAYVVRNVYRAT